MRNMPVEDFISLLSVRLQNRFSELFYRLRQDPKQKPIKTLYDLFKLNHMDFRITPNFGEKSFDSMMDVLKSLALQNKVLTVKQISSCPNNRTFYNLLRAELENPSNKTTEKEISSSYNKLMELFLRGQAVNAEIAGMQAENQQRTILGQAMAYNDQDFFKCAEELRNLAAEALKY